MNRSSQHLNVHAAWQSWSNEQVLHVASAYSNPFRWRTRRELFNDFRQQIQQQPNVKLYVGELAYGDRPFEVTGAGANGSGSALANGGAVGSASAGLNGAARARAAAGTNTSAAGSANASSSKSLAVAGSLLADVPFQSDAQFRTSAELFHKENILNETVKTFDPNWKYGAVVDGDFTFTRHDWALEAIHQLQHYDFVQLFSTYTDLSATGYGGNVPGRVTKSFAQSYIENGHQLPPGWTDFSSGYAYGQGGWQSPGATGGAWAFRRSAFDTVGGMMDQAILGHGDWFMAFGLVSAPLAVQGTVAERRYHPHYVAMIAGWQNRGALLKKNIGVVDQFALHHFHGSKSKRGYESRDDILVKYQFDPLADIRRNSQGIYELTGNKPGLRDAIRRYFIARQEDE
jgi:hypothetical protein